MRLSTETYYKYTVCGCFISIKSIQSSLYHCPYNNIFLTLLGNSMRYREQDFINQVDGVIEPIIGNNVLLLTAVIGLFIGIIFVVGGRFGKQLWIIVWGAGLVIVSIVYIVYMLLGYR